MTSLLAPIRRSTVARRANTLRAGVLGANDGIVSVAAIVVGVAGATALPGPLLVAGLAALIGGAVSMALGEYVSVSSQRDSERAARGGADAEDDADEANPWAAAVASAASFLSGGVLPLIAVLAARGPMQVPVTVVVVLIALAATGAAGARLGGAPAARATVRTVVGGGLALALTWTIGMLLGTTGVV